MQPDAPQPLSEPALETAVLGAMLGYAEAVPAAMAFLRSNADIFHMPKHKTIFRAIVALHGDGNVADVYTVAAHLRSLGQLERIGAAYLGKMAQIGRPDALAISKHCAVLLDVYAKRRTAEIAKQLLATAYDITADAGDVLAEAQKALNDVQAGRELRQAQTLGQLFDTAIDEVVAATMAPGGITGVPSGLNSLDSVTGGWQPGQLIIVAARPGMGKTSLTLGIANLAEASGHTGLFCSLEMSAMELVKKAIGTETGYSTNQLQRGGGMKPDEAEYLRVRGGALKKSKLLIDDTPALGIGELRAKATKAKSEHNIKILYVDYLQLMQGSDKGNREQEIGSISRGLKMIAKELHIPVIALSQLSRAVETRGGEKKPQLSDLRESGSIEQDADMVIFAYRPEYYNLMQDADGNSTEGLTELIIAKHRSGALASPVVKSDMRTGKYEDLPENKPYEVPFNARQLPASEFEADKGDPPF